MATVTKSIRLSEDTVRLIDQFRGEQNFNQVINRAVRRWLKIAKRKQKDAMIVAALQSRSPQRIAEEQEIVQQASASSLRILESSGR